MNMAMLAPNVRPVPHRAIQRMTSSLPRGTKISASAKTAGMNTTADIQSRSVSAITTSARRRHPHEIRQHNENADRGQHQKQHVTPQETRLHAPQPRPYPVGHVAYQIGQTIDDAVVEQAAPLRQQHPKASDRMNDPIDDAKVERLAPVADHQRRPHHHDAVKPIE